MQNVSNGVEISRDDLTAIGLHIQRGSHLGEKPDIVPAPVENQTL
jgi:hypothetical protein